MFIFEGKFSVPWKKSFVGFPNAVRCLVSRLVHDSSRCMCTQYQLVESHILAIFLSKIVCDFLNTIQ